MKNLRRSSLSVENRQITLTIRVWPGLVLAESRAKRKRALRGRNHAEGYPGGLIETMNGRREDSFLRRPTSIGSKDPHALKIPAPQGRNLH
jgi:hypothetical protein